MSFTTSRRINGLFRLKQQECSKSGKIDIFPKGLTHGFGPKMANFYDIPERKKPFYAIKTGSSKS